MPNLPPTPSSDEELVRVEIVTLNGDRYMFPGVQFKMLWLVIRNETIDSFQQISLVNHQRSCLVVVTTELQQVLVDGQPFWTRP